jgi:hypothetical protein
MAVAKVAVKLPNFWTDKPEAWFAITEAQFRRGRITVQSAIFHHVLCKLAPDVIAFVLDIVVTSPEEDPYTALKDRLLTSFKPASGSKWQNFSTSRTSVTGSPPP